MADLTEDIQNALDCIEANLTGDLSVQEIAKKAFLPRFTSKEPLESCAGSVPVRISAIVG